jgi:outer membrane immunogenic protein
VRGKLLTLSALILALGGEHLAFAADMAVKAPFVPMPVAAYNWGGWYVGGNVGYGWGIASDPSISFVDPAPGVGFATYFASGGNAVPNVNPKGVTGGGQIGFNWTFTPSWVVGFIADFQGSGIKDSGTNTVPPLPIFPASTNQFNSEQIDWFGTLRAKVGFAQNNWLLYATGGLAYGRIATSGSFTIPGVFFSTGSNSATNIGWAAGAGLNYGLTSNWILGVEYLYVDLGDTSYTETQPVVAVGTTAATSLTVNNHATVQVARVSLDYKF